MDWHVGYLSYITPQKTKKNFDLRDCFSFDSNKCAVLSLKST